MTDESTPSGDPTINDRPRRVAFEYIKSNFFRVVHVDGVVGGPGPRNTVCVNFFSERLPIPKRQVFELRPDGRAGDEVEAERRARPALVREIETALVMDLSTARAVIQWLGNAIAMVERSDSAMPIPPDQGY